MTIDELTARDWPAVARIFEQGLDLGTFEDAVPSWEDWDATHLARPRLVARDDEVLGWAALGPVSARACYRGVAEDSVYIATEARGRGVGRALLTELCRQADEAGDVWTIQAHMFADNLASRALHEACGFRLVGIRERLAQKHGEWRDTALLERRAPSSA